MWLHETETDHEFVDSMRQLLKEGDEAPVN
jgi:hypothetical protein